MRFLTLLRFFKTEHFFFPELPIHFAHCYERICCWLWLNLVLLCCTNTPGLPQASFVSMQWNPVPIPVRYPNCYYIIHDRCGWLRNQDGLLYQWDGNLWHPAPFLPDERVTAFYPISEKNIWVGVNNNSQYRNYLKHFNGTTWQTIFSPNTVPIRDLFFLTPEDGWAVCDWGEIMHYDGNTWRRIASPTNYHLNCIRMTSSDHGWISGESRGHGILLGYRQNKWEILNYHARTELKEIIVKDSSSCWINAVNQIIVQVSDDSISEIPLSHFMTNDPKISIDKFVRIGNTPGVMTADGNCYCFRNGQWCPVPPDSLAPGYRWRLDNDHLYHLAPVIRTHELIKKYDGFNLIPIDDMEPEYGVAIGDVNGDGILDIYIVNHTGTNRLISSAEIPQKPYLPGSATLAETAGLGGEDLALAGTTNLLLYDAGVTMADYDNDGDLDLYLCNLYQRNALFRNNGRGHFRNVTDFARVGGLAMTFSQNGIWGDVNNDGWLDLFVANQLASDVLYLNDGKGRFRDVTVVSGLQSDGGSQYPAFSDIDNDGDLDLFIPHDHGKIRLLRNDGMIRNTLNFNNITVVAGLDTTVLTAYRCGIFGDVDNDGDMDLFITRAFWYNMLYLNDGSGTFTDVSLQAGFTDSSNSNGAVFFDADNDGYLDLFVGNQGPDFFYHNNGNGSFTEMTEAVGLKINGNTTGIAVADLPSIDKYSVLPMDGALDLYVASKDKSSYIAKNNQGGSGFLQFKLIGTISNRDAIGARMFIYHAGHLGEKTYLCGSREIQGGCGFASMSSTIVHFGVQPDSSYDVHVIFPSGQDVIRQNLKAGQFITIYEQENYFRWFSELKRWLYRNLYNMDNYFEVGLAILFLLFIVFSLEICKKKNWHSRMTLVGLIIWPTFLYFVGKIFTFWEVKWLYFSVPFALAVIGLGTGICYNYFLNQQINREDRLTELFDACRAFEHSQIQVSYLNQMSLVFNNLVPDQKVPAPLTELIEELVTNFYQFTYPQVKRIQQLASQLFPAFDQAIFLRNYYLKMSKSLDEIKILSHLDKVIPTYLIYSLRDNTARVKDTLNKINIKVSKYFSSPIFPTLAKLQQFYQQQQIAIELTGNTMADELQVRMPATDLVFIFANLFTNAIRAMITSTTKQILIQVVEKENEVIVKFRDSGAGIPPELQQNLFEDGFTTKNSTKSGFGLFQSKTKLDKYGGSIHLVESAAGTGTEFLIRFKKIK